MSTGLEKRSLLSWSVEPGERAPVRSTDAGAENFIATAGAHTTSVVVAAALTGATADVYVGQILECVDATQTQNVGLTAEIVQFVPGSDALVFDPPFPATVTAGDQFKTYLPPDPVAVETTGGGVVVTAADRGDYAAEVTDYYVGDYLVSRYGANGDGAMRQVTGFTTATGAFTSSNFAATIAVGDLFYLRRFPKFWGPPNVSYKREDLTVEAQRLDFSHEQSVGGSRTWTASCTLPLKSSGTAAGDGTAGVAPPELDRPLSAIMTKTTVTGTEIDNSGTASTVSVLQVDTGEMPAVGTLILDSAGRAAMVYTTSADGGNPDDVTVHPPLFRAPVEAEDIHGGVTYTPKTTGHKTMTLDYFEGGTTNVKLYGGMPTVKITDFGRNKVPKIQFDYKGNYYLECNRALPTTLTPTFDTLRPVDAKDCYAILSTGSVGSSTETRLTLESADIDFGIEIGQEDAFTLPDAIYGNRYLGHMCTINVLGFLDTAAPSNTWLEIQRYYGGQTFTLLLQHGRRAGKTVAFYAHKCEWLDPQHSAAGGLRKIAFKAKVLASDVTSIPDFALGFL